MACGAKGEWGEASFSKLDKVTKMNIIKMYIIFSVCFRPQKKTKVIHFQERIKLQTTLREQLPSG